MRLYRIFKVLLWKQRKCWTNIHEWSREHGYW